MASFLAVAQAFKIAVGLTQFAFALWIMIRAHPTRTDLMFALGFGANGVAFVIWNFTRLGLRTPHSLALEGRGVCDWIAVVAVVLFAVFFLFRYSGRATLLILPTCGRAAGNCSSVTFNRPSLISTDECASNRQPIAEEKPSWDY